MALQLWFPHTYLGPKIIQSCDRETAHHKPRRDSSISDRIVPKCCMCSSAILGKMIVPSMDNGAESYSTSGYILSTVHRNVPGGLTRSSSTRSGHSHLQWENEGRPEDILVVRIDLLVAAVNKAWTIPMWCSTCCCITILNMGYNPATSTALSFEQLMQKHSNLSLPRTIIARPTAFWAVQWPLYLTFHRYPPSGIFRFSPMLCTFWHGRSSFA